jgi:phosphatidylglycerol---prolipoprotein diacylglyceryl transferase
MTLFSITWDVSPIIFSIGSISVRWYGLLFAMSFAVGYVIMLRFFKKEKLPEALLDKLSMYMLIATVVGARLGHVFFYEWGYYQHHLGEILMVWKGGLASHGAAIGILTALYFFARSSKRTYLWTLDRIVIVVALSGFFIRTGNLMNSEIYGKLTDLPWGFIFIKAGETLPRHPTQIYEALCYLCIFFFILWYYYHKNGAPREGFIFGFFLSTLFSVRFLLEFLKEPQVNFENNMVLNMGQLLSIPFVVAGLIIIFRKQKVKTE